MLITKKPENTKQFNQEHFFFSNARSGFYSILHFLEFAKDERILLPSYIGWSSREGSGIYDPVVQAKMAFKFYRIRNDLSIDISSIEDLIDDKVKACLLVNYFGFRDKYYEKICNLLLANNIIIIEDEAHSLYSNFIGKSTGTFSDFSIFSLHKMLPYSDGGMVICRKHEYSFKKYYTSLYHDDLYRKSIFEYNFWEIARVRRNNYLTLEQLIKKDPKGIRPLFKFLPAGIIPQTFPIIVGNNKRDDLYFGLNNSGFGVVSLYHSLINEIQQEHFPDSYNLAKKILNLPVHQDTDADNLQRMVQEMKRILQ